MSFYVKLEIFKPTGKWYANGEYRTEKQHLFEIWDEVRQMVKDGKLPGLIDGSHWSKTSEDWMVSVDVPDHPDSHPRIVRTIYDNRFD